MTTTAGHPIRGQMPRALARVLERTAKTGIYLVRGVSRDVQRTARARAAREGTTLSAVLVRALHEYAERTWTPREDTPAH